MSKMWFSWEQEKWKLENIRNFRQQVDEHTQETSKKFTTRKPEKTRRRSQGERETKKKNVSFINNEREEIKMRKFRLLHRAIFSL